MSLKDNKDAHASSHPNHASTDASAQAAGSLASHWRLLVSLMIGGIIGVGSYWWRPLSPSTCFIIAWDSAVMIYLSSLLLMMRSDTMHQHLTGEHEGKALILTLVSIASAICLYAISRQTQIGKDYQGVERLLNLALTVGTIFLAWLMIQAIFALQYAYQYFAAIKAGGALPMTFPENTDDEPPLTQVGFEDFFYTAVSIGTSGQTADIPFTSTEGRKLGILHSIIAFMFNLAIISLLINIISGYL